MNDYNTTEQLIDSIIALPKGKRLNLVTALIHRIIKVDTGNLIKLLRDSNVTDAAIAKALQLDQAKISRDYPRK